MNISEAIVGKIREQARKEGLKTVEALLGTASNSGLKPESVENRFPNTLNVSFPGKVGAEILHSLDGVASSTESACHSGWDKLSPVSKAMRIPPETGMGAIRFSLGRTTTGEEIEATVKSLKSIVG